MSAQTTTAHPGSAIDAGAPATTRQERFVPAPPAEVFALLADVAAWPDWQPEVSKVCVEGELRVGSTFRWHSGVAIRSTVTVHEPARRLAWTGRAIGTRAIHTWELVEVDGGTLVRTEESMSGWLPRLMRRTAQRTLESGVRNTLDALVAAAR